MHTGIKSEIIALAQSAPTVEVCGFIYRDWTGEPKVLPCENKAVNTTEEFEIGIDDQLRMEGLGHLLGVYHSHPASSSGFSPADLECAEEMALPFYLYDIQSGDWHEFIAKSFQRNPMGQSWCLGFQDCYEVVRDYFRQTHSIHMRDYDRDESFSHEDRGVISASYEREGFAATPISEVQTHDVLVFKTEKALPQHFGVYTHGNRFIHHPRNGLSREEQLTDRWISRIVSVYRHKSLGKTAQNPCNP